MKTKFLLLLCLFVFAKPFKAQNKYSFSEINNLPYTDLTGDINLSGLFDANTGLYTIPNVAGETFNFFDLAYTFGGLKTISVGEGPFLRVDKF